MQIERDPYKMEVTIFDASTDKPTISVWLWYRRTRDTLSTSYTFKKGATDWVGFKDYEATIRCHTFDHDELMNARTFIREMKEVIRNKPEAFIPSETSLT